MKSLTLRSLILALCLVFMTNFALFSQTEDSYPKFQVYTEESADQDSLPATDYSRYIDDKAELISSENRIQIGKRAAEIEEKAGVRVLIKTEISADKPEIHSAKIDSFFSGWIREIGIEKRGILLYAVLPDPESPGKVYLRVGVGLKFIFTQEIGQRLLAAAVATPEMQKMGGTSFVAAVQLLHHVLLEELKVDLKLEKPKRFKLGDFLWSSKEAIAVGLIIIFFFYIVIFLEKCPRCGGSLKITREVLKEPSEDSIGFTRKIYSCSKCMFSRRKKEPVYPSGIKGLIMKFKGSKRNY
ncbi:MAG: TPM domain-containing protein [Candidatus Riflebacteria bacterium]|nr:TPM domain-containing protein [Candidatus Riflebacteria bacterium]